jgi:aminoglycoside 6'-N-acetyltransferase
MTSCSNSQSVVPELSGARVIIRPARSGELTGLADRIAADPEASPWWGDDPDKVRRDLLGYPEYTVLVIEHERNAVGVIAFEEENTPEYHSASIDITLLQCCIGLGLGPEALRLLIDWLIAERGHHRITIDPAATNSRAIRAYEKVGFRPIGIMRQYERDPSGNWRDGLLMELLASDLTR